MSDPHTVIWDFDGTLLPSTPHDSEQTLILALCQLDAIPRLRIKRLVAPLLAEADRRQWFCTDRRRRIYLKLYPWLLQGIPAEFLDGISRNLALKISKPDREALLRLKADGHAMAVVSCGTADLSERVLCLAGIDGCFGWVTANRLRVASGTITGMDVGLLNAESKVRCVQDKGFDLGACAVVGDGYTDLPLLDRAKIPIMMDPTGEKLRCFKARGYHFSRSIAEAADIISKHRENGR